MFSQEAKAYLGIIGGLVIFVLGTKAVCGLIEIKMHNDVRKEMLEFTKKLNSKKELEK